MKKVVRVYDGKGFTTTTDEEIREKIQKKADWAAETLFAQRSDGIPFDIDSDGLLWFVRGMVTGVITCGAGTMDLIEEQNKIIGAAEKRVFSSID